MPRVQKDFTIRNLIKQLLTKYHFFTKLPQISHIHNNRNFKSIILNRSTASTLINFMAGTCKESTFSFLPFVSPYDNDCAVGLL